MPQLARHRLHDDFFGVEHAVDDNSESLAADLGDDNETAIDLARVPVETEQLTKTDERQELVSQPEHSRVLDALDAVLTATACAHEFDDG